MNDTQNPQPNVRTIQPQTFTNKLKKRKLDESNDNSDNEPDRKKRKLNEKPIPDTLTKLITSHKLLQTQNESLIQQNNESTKKSLHYKQGLNIYKNEANKWKSKYIQLYSQLSIFINNNNTIAMDNNINNNHNNPISFQRRQPNHSDNHSDDYSNTNKHMNKHILNNKNKSKTNRKITSKKNKQNNIKSKQIISNEDNINNNRDNKYMLIRDRLLQMGFDKNEVINRISLYNGSNKSSEFVFNQLINTFTPDTYTPTKKRLRSHDKPKTQSKTDSVNNKNDNNINSNNNEFENSYYISVNCHICNTHFQSMSTYIIHLKQHYDNDNKTWMQCDFDQSCHNKKFHGVAKFIGHISRHLNVKPYKCNMINNGIKCNGASRWKYDMKSHWKSHYRKSKSKSKCNDNIEGVSFEDSYYIFVDCYICKKHFSDFNKYEKHIEYHYNIDPNKTWKQCDFGCKIDPQKPLFRNNKTFISHIAQHTNQKPYKCNIITNGIKCNISFGTKGNCKIHWKNHFKPKTNEFKHKKKKKKKKKFKKNTATKCDARQQNVNNILSFEDSYHVSVNCHLCKKYFDNFGKYQSHLEKHYNIDPNKTWKKCDFNKCERDPNLGLFTGSGNFIGHIATHTNDKPFKCDIIKCPMAYGSRHNLKTHWKNTHSKTNCKTTNSINNQQQKKKNTFKEFK